MQDVTFSSGWISMCRSGLFLFNLADSDASLINSVTPQLSITSKVTYKVGSEMGCLGSSL